MMSLVSVWLFSLCLSLSPLPSQQADIPPAPAGCERAECLWWEQVRAAAAETQQAFDRKEKEIAEVYRKAPRNPNLPGNPPILPPDFPDLVARLDADIQGAVEKFRDQISLGNKTPYAVPLPDSPTNRPIILHREKARYTEEARAARIQGTVLLSFKFQADGTITDVNVLQGLDAGLNDEAILAARKVVFLPVVKNGKFVSVASRMEIKFTLF